MKLRLSLKFGETHSETKLSKIFCFGACANARFKSQTAHIFRFFYKFRVTFRLTMKRWSVLSLYKWRWLVTMFPTFSYVTKTGSRCSSSGNFKFICHLWFITFYCRKGYRHSLTEKRKGKIYIIKQKFSHYFVFIGCTLSWFKIYSEDIKFWHISRGIKKNLWRQYLPLLWGVVKKFWFNLFWFQFNENGRLVE